MRRGERNSLVESDSADILPRSAKRLCLSEKIADVG
jgi:hypothetical protein